MRETLVKTEEFKDSPVGRIPKDWEFVSVADIAIDVTDGDHHTPERSNSGIFLLSARNILNGCLALEDVDFVPEHEYQRMIRRCHPEPGDILISCSGTIGRVCEVPENFRCVLVRSAALVKLDKTRCRSRFIEAVLQSGIVQTQILMEQLQAAQPNLFQNSIKRLSFPLPPVHEQERIAEILDTVEKTIAHTSSLIAKLKQMKAGLLHDLLTRGLDENGELRDAIAHPEQFKPSPLGQIPQKWKFCKFGDQVTLQRGFDITSKEMRPGNVPVIASSGLVGYHDTPMANPPGVITGRKGSLGEAFYIEEAYYPTDTTLWVTDFHGNYPKFVRRFIQWMRLERLDSATACPTLNRNFVHPIPVAFPPVNEQIRIEKVLDTYDTRIRAEEAYRDKLKLQKQGLMHDLLTGKVRVKNA